MLRPRGSVGETPWITSIDLSLAWIPKFANKNLTLKLNVFNVFNAKRALQYDETGDLNRGSPTPNRDFRLPDTYQSPRAVRLTARYDFSL